MLVYVSQGSITSVKGENIIYLQYFIFSQIIVALNQPNNIDKYQCKEDEENLVKSISNIETGEFQGIEIVLAYIIVRGDENEFFLSYGFEERDSKILYCTLN